MSKSLTVLIPETNTALGRIKKFMSNQESGVILTAVEEKMLSRMIFANGLIAENKFTRDQVQEKIMEKYGVSVWTARNDINNTFSLFIDITDDYKRYTLFHHAEQLKRLLQRWIDDKSMAALVPKLAAEITRAIASLPVRTENPNLPAPVIVLDIKGELKKPDMDADEARKMIDELIQMEDKEVTDIDYEDLKNGK